MRAMIQWHTIQMGGGRLDQGNAAKQPETQSIHILFMSHTVQAEKLNFIVTFRMDQPSFFFT